MKCLFLCAGSPHPVSGRPTPMLACPDGDYTLEKIVRAGRVPLKDCIFAIREEDETAYNMTKSFQELLGGKITVLTMKSDANAGPLETTVRTIERLGLSGPLLVRDCDSFFETPLPQNEGNYVAFANLDDSSPIAARSLSFLKVNDQGIILDIQERHAISNLFAAGAYAFEEAKIISQMYQRLVTHAPKKLYVSECIKEAIFYRRDTFRALAVEGFVDWGNARGWREWCAPQKAYFVDLDGVLCSNGGRSFRPRQSEATPIEENIEALRLLVARGAQIIITTSRLESLRAMTMEQLARWNVPYAQLVMGCRHQQRVVINDYSRTNPYPSCLSVNILRNSKELKDALSPL